MFKRQRHAYQHEVRPMWEPKRTGRTRKWVSGDEVGEEGLDRSRKESVEREMASIQAIDLKVPEAREHCTRLF